MIQKLRNSILNEETKGSMFFAIIVIFIAPSLFFIFDIWKDKFSITKIGGYSLDRRHIQLKFMDHMSFIKNLYDALDRKTAGMLKSHIMGGLSNEVFVLNSELRRAYMTSLFMQEIGNINLAKNYCRKYISSRSDWAQTMGLLGNVVSEAMLGNDKILSDLEMRGVLFDSVSSYVLSSFSSIACARLYLVPISMFNGKKSNLTDAVEVKLKRYEYKKTKFEANIPDELVDQEAIVLYENLAGSGALRSSIEESYSVLKIPKSGMSKKDLEMVISGRSELEDISSYDSLESSLGLSSGSIIRGTQIIKRDPKTMLSSFHGDKAIPDDLAKMFDNGEESFIAEHVGFFYVISLVERTGGKELAFDSIKSDLKKSVLSSHVESNIIDVIEQDRKKLESKEQIKRSGIISTEFNYKGDSKNNSNKDKESWIHLIEGKLPNIYRENATFLEKAEGSIYLWHIVSIKKLHSASHISEKLYASKKNVEIVIEANKKHDIIDNEGLF
jgi:hypothetical protein